MNQKNSLGLNICFKDEDNPFKLFEEWFDLAKKKELNDPNALALATSDKEGNPNVRMVLLKDFNDKGFVFYTNLNSPKSEALLNNPKDSMCFHWKSLLRQIRIFGTIESVSDEEANEYYNSRKYGSRIGAWASKQSKILKNREELLLSIEKYKEKFPDSDQVLPSSILLIMVPPDPNAHISPSRYSAVYRFSSVPLSTTPHPLLTS